MSEESLDKPQVVQCVATATETVPEQTSTISTDGKNSMAMSIVAGGLEFKLDTVIDPRSESAQLGAKLELALMLLQMSENRLAEAMREIGQLQERLRRAGMEITA